MDRIIIDVTSSELTVSGTKMDLFTALGILERAKDSVKLTGFDTIIVSEQNQAETNLEQSIAELDKIPATPVETYVNPNATPEVA